MQHKIHNKMKVYSGLYIAMSVSRKLNRHDLACSYIVSHCDNFKSILLLCKSAQQGISASDQSTGLGHTLVAILDRQIRLTLAVYL